MFQIRTITFLRKYSKPISIQTDKQAKSVKFNKMIQNKKTKSEISLHK